MANFPKTLYEQAAAGAGSIAPMPEGARPEPAALVVSRCGGAQHHFRNGMLVILGCLSSLRRAGLGARPEIATIKAQILRMDEALGNCQPHEDKRCKTTINRAPS